MEYQLSSFPILLSFLFFVFMMVRLRIRKKSKNNHSNLNLPPGPWKLPLLGNMHQLFGSLPHRSLRDLAIIHGPLMHLKLGEVSHIIISSAEAAKQVLKNHDLNFAQRPRFLASKTLCYDCTDIAFAPYGDYWRQLRKICTIELLSAKRVQSYRPIRDEEVSNLIRSISSSAGLPINLTMMIFSLTNDITARAAFGGRSCENNEEMKRLFQKIIKLGGGFSLVDFFPSIKWLEVLSGMSSELKRLHQEADKILENIINEHRSTMQKTGEGEADDLVHVLLHIQEHGDLEFSLTTDNIKAVIFDIFLGGSETSSSTVEWAISEALKNPRVMKKAQAEVRNVFDKKGTVDEIGLSQLHYLKLVIKETLRLHPPLPLLLPRECRESCKIFGYEIPKGSKVIVNAWAIGRDPNYWTEAANFYPERFLNGPSVDYKGIDFEFIPFGAGRRICPGMSFGLANVELPLAQLLYHFNWKLPNGMKNNDLDMSEEFGVTIARKNPLYVIPIPYNSK